MKDRHSVILDPPSQASRLQALPDRPHACSVEDILDQLKVDPAFGLSTEEVNSRKARFGPNRLPYTRPRPVWQIFLEQFIDPVIAVLGTATLLSLFFGEWIEGVAVGVVILITVLIGFFMEWQALRSIQALKKLAQNHCRVWRFGKEHTIPAFELVPGDILLLDMGDVISADARLLTHQNLAVKEASLTGESTQVDKQTSPLPASAPLADRDNMLFKGTIVSRGHAKAVVVATGADTELGRISKLASEAEEQTTPLEKKLRKLSLRLIWITLGLALVIAAVGYLQGKDLLLMIKTAIALAVAAIPEGLPIVATIALARGMLRLARKRVIIKNLQAVQTLGEVSIICTDKTGTLTENKMSVRVAMTTEGIWKSGEPGGQTDALEAMVRVGVLCNKAKLSEKENIGDPIEQALLEWAVSLGSSPDRLKEQFTEVLEIPFDTEAKLMATVNQVNDGYWACVKGAPESLIPLCTQRQFGSKTTVLSDGNEWEDKTASLARSGLRTLAFAYKQLDRPIPESEVYQDLILLGVIGCMDPPRSDVEHAIQTCFQAGIRVVMVTGDHPETARTIARELNLFRNGEKDTSVMRGQELETIDGKQAEDRRKLLETIVFARVSPAQKLELVNLYQSENRIVGMTGDGVNDAPALKKADIGIAMGIRGTEAAKEVADVILRDDHFSSIALAIRQGRIIFENIRKFVVYLLSSNLAEILSVTVASLTSLTLPLLPLQILYLNLITDVFPALALGWGEGGKHIMEHPPRPSDEPILPGRLWTSTIIFGLCMTAGVIGITLFATFQLGLDRAEVNNLAFYTLVLAQLLHVFNLPERNVSFFRNEVTRNPWVWGAIALCVLLTGIGYWVAPLRETLSLVPLGWSELRWIAVFSIGSVMLIQLFKRLRITV